MTCVSSVPSAPKGGKLTIVKRMMQENANKNNVFTSGLCLNCAVTQESYPARGLLLLESLKCQSCSFPLGFLLHKNRYQFMVLFCGEGFLADSLPYQIYVIYQT